MKKKKKIKIDVDKNQQRRYDICNKQAYEMPEGEKHMKRFFLIDVENVGKAGLEGVDKVINCEDKVIMFHAMIHSYKISEALMERVRMKAGVTEEVNMYMHTKNAMDFQLCTYLGYLVGENGTGGKYYIVSQDKGYQAAIEFIKSKFPEVIIEQVSNIKDIADAIDIIEEVKKLLPGYSKKAISVVCTAICSTSDRRDYHNYLGSHLCKNGEELYNITKVLFKQVHNLPEQRKKDDVEN